MNVMCKKWKELLCNFDGLRRALSVLLFSNEDVFPFPEEEKL
jgi:hypothetical protein